MAADKMTYGQIKRYVQSQGWDVRAGGYDWNLARDGVSPCDVTIDPPAVYAWFVSELIPAIQVAGQWNWPDDLDMIGPADYAARPRLPAPQAGVPFGTVAEELEVSADLHFLIHNAAGITSVQAGLSVAEALIRLRAHALSHDRPVTDVARDVVARILQLS